MDNEKNDSYYVGKIKSDLEFVIVHTKGKTMEEIKADELLTDSIMFRIIQIAENNSKLSADFKTKHKGVPWMAIKGMRNKIVHDYGVIDLTFVYSTVTHAMPDMYEKLKDVQ